MHADDFAPSSWQSNLFTRNDPALILFVETSQITDADFLTVLVAANLRYVIDLRLAPRFDIGTLSRKSVFALFAKANIRYYDFAGRLGVSSARDAKMNPQLLASEIVQSIFSPNPIEGPIAFLVDAAQFSDGYMHALVKGFPANGDRGWETLKLPHATIHRDVNAENVVIAEERRLIFISHANPEDNAFTVWLGAQLSNAGYEVWSDVTKLIGGEEFWDSIEDAIRLHARKVVVVLSRVSQQKKSVLDEINCAVLAERTQGLEGYVVPVRLDDLPFSEVRANLARKNVIDFSSNWADGLAKLLKVFERDGVSRITNGVKETADWYGKRLGAKAQVQSQEEVLTSNWLPIISLPQDILIHDTNLFAQQVDALESSIGYPYFRYHRLFGGFAEASAVQVNMPPEVKISERYRIPMDRFLKGYVSETPGLSGRDASNLTVSLIKQAWDTAAKRRGLLPYVTASRATAWYLPKGLAPNDTVVFKDFEGKSRRKLLVGRSDKRQVNWHFAVYPRPVLGATPRLEAKLHVVFSADGRTLIDSKEKMHALRRGFCKSWWNDRWRDLLLAYFHWFSDGDTKIELDVGAPTPLVISSSPARMLSPISPFVEQEERLDSGDAVEEIDWDDPDVDIEFEEPELSDALDEQAPST